MCMGALDGSHTAAPGKIVGGVVAATVGLLLYFHSLLKGDRERTRDAIKEALREMDSRLRKLEASSEAKVWRRELREVEGRLRKVEGSSAPEEPGDDTSENEGD